MTCNDIHTLLHGYVDGELDLPDNVEIEAHLQGCSECAQMHRSLLSLRTAIKSEASYYEPPAGLQARIRTAVGGASGKAWATRRPMLVWLAAAAALLLVVGAAWSFMHFLPMRRAPELTEELVASHVRSQMLSSHLVDVQSSNQHTVKPWFKGKVNFSPTVSDLSAQEYKLIGGRLDYLNHRPVAAIVYQRREHVINLFIWPSEQDSKTEPVAQTRQGFHLVSWTQSGMAHVAVSDLNEAELKEFAELIQNPPPQR